MLSNTGTGFGVLEIRPGTLHLELRRATAAFLGAILGTEPVMTHGRTRVEVYCAWICSSPLFWRNTGVVIRGRRLSGVIAVAAWNRRRLFEQLARAGFEVVRHDTCVGIGYGAIRRRR